MGLLDQVLGQVLGGGGLGGAGNRSGFPQGGGGFGGSAGGLGGGLGGLLSGGKGPLAMAILALLASKNMKSGAGGYGSVLRDMFGGGGGASMSGLPGGGGMLGGNQPSGGGFMDQIGSMLGGGQNAPGGVAPGGMGGGYGSGGGGPGGALGGGMLGGMLGGGLGNLVSRFSENGHGETARSWIGSGPNQPISPHELEQALGPEDIDELSRETGMGRDELLSGLSETLPQVVDGLTPEGRLPNDDEHGRWV